MASTSEELSSQADLLQSTISFFRIDEGVNKKAGAQTSRSQISSSVSTETVKSQAKAISYTQTKEGGVDLDMDESGSDSNDSQFEKY